MPARRDDMAPGVARRDTVEGISQRDGPEGMVSRDDDVEGHVMHRGDDGVSRRDADGVVSRDGVRSSATGTDEDDVEGHAMLRDAGESLHRGLPGSGGEFARRGPGDNPHGDH